MLDFWAIKHMQSPASSLSKIDIQAMIFDYEAYWIEEFWNQEKYNEQYLYRCFVCYVLR